jgi:hypothetical protein
MNKQSPISRRQAISELGTGLVAVAAPQIFAAERSSQQQSLPGKLQDPTTKYPKPPFNGQSQPWPGLASFAALCRMRNPRRRVGKLKVRLMFARIRARRSWLLSAWAFSWAFFSVNNQWNWILRKVLEHRNPHRWSPFKISPLPSFVT